MLARVFLYGRCARKRDCKFFCVTLNKVLLLFITIFAKETALLDMENKIQLSKDEIIMGFVASCIEDVADTLGVDYFEVYRRMDAVKMIDEYIIPNYEVLHSESRRNVTEGLIDTLKRWEESI